MRIERPVTTTHQHRVEPLPAKSTKTSQVAGNRIKQPNESTAKMPPTQIGIQNQKTSSAFQRALGKK